MTSQIRFLADEDFDNDILRGILRRRPALDIVRVQDVGLSGCDDPQVLAWAAEEARILLTHDVSSIQQPAYARVDRGLPMPGVLAVRQSLPIGEAIEEILLVAECSLEGEWDGRVVYLPMSGGTR